MTIDRTAEAPSRYLVGIDLGTTNSAVAFVDTESEPWAVQDFPIPQLVSPGEVEAREVLPSFHYEAATGEFSPGALRLPWQSQNPNFAVGAFAREHGAAAPGRLVVSAKSWLSHSGVDRTAGLLPWHGAPDVARLSPVEVSTRFLAHMRSAWDAQNPEHPLGGQEVVLTVPASFDEVARELTVQAARRAGLGKAVLVEEPQAAFYAWIHAQGAAWDKRVRPGQTILVCDVGGGTSDFTLIRVKPAGKAKVLFHRVAVGEHVILGGDNLDLALAHYVEKKMVGDGRLDPRQWGPLVRACRKAKETLLGKRAPHQLTLSVATGGSKLIGGAAQAQVSRQEVQDLLADGFLPRVPLSARPAARRSGFQEFGLPYATDAGITRYLAAFLCAHGDAGTDEPGAAAVRAARPDLVLFNGGLFESALLRDRLIEILSGWFSSDAEEWGPRVLKNERLDLAVSRGAAYYGMVRRGRGVRISGGLAHSYYIGVETTPSTGSGQAGSGQAPSTSSGRAGAEAMAVCLLPAGVEEGQTVEMAERTFELLIRQPAEFPLYFSSTRTTDAPGALVPVDPEQLSSLPPIRTVLQSGRKSAAESVSVRLHARLTEIGTMEIWCAEVGGDRQWRLQFDVRAATRSDAARHESDAEAEGVLDEQILETCRFLLRSTFQPADRNHADAPAGIVKRLELATGLGRHEWPTSLLRALFERMFELETGRSLGVEHESRWLNLAGFCLRPGYGLAVDDWRVAQAWRLYAAGVRNTRNELCRAEWWIFWRRVAGGLSAGQQATLADPLLADWRTWTRKAGSGVKGRSPAFQFGPHESAEVWRLLGSLELLKPELKSELGEIILGRISREKTGAALRDAGLFAIGRLAARIPVYGPLNALASIDTVQAWTQRLMTLDIPGDRLPFAIVQLCRLTGDRYRDISPTLRESVLQWLTGRQSPAHYLDLVRDGGSLRDEEQQSVFGESLPRGLRIQ